MDDIDISREAVTHTVAAKTDNSAACMLLALRAALDRAEANTALAVMKGRSDE